MKRVPKLKESKHISIRAPVKSSRTRRRRKKIRTKQFSIIYCQRDIFTLTFRSRGKKIFKKFIFPIFNEYFPLIPTITRHRTSSSLPFTFLTYFSWLRFTRPQKRKRHADSDIWGTRLAPLFY